MEEHPSAGRVIIVSGGDHHISLEIMRKLREIGHEAVVMADPNDVVHFAREIELADVMQTFPLVCPRIPDVRPLVENYTERTPSHGWYQQFAGKRGRPPRY